MARETYDYESQYKLYLLPLGDDGNGGNNNTDNGNTGDTTVNKGDVNKDGRITSSDYVLIKNYIMGTNSLDETAKQAADYNLDGKITSSDYVLIKDYIMSN